jgi:hypothetical protein
MNTGFGERGRNRTFNLLIKSQLLCQLSYAPAELWSEFEAQPFAADLRRCCFMPQANPAVWA